MCDIKTMASAALAISTSVLDYQAQDTQADAQEEYNKQIQKNAEVAHQNDLEALRVQQQQDEDQAEEEIFQNQVAARQARSRAKTAAGESGVTGLSVDALLADFERQEANFKDAVTANLANRDQQRRLEENSALTRYQSRVNSRQPVSRPSLTGTALNLASQGLTIKQDYDRLNDTS